MSRLFYVLLALVLLVTAAPAQAEESRYALKGEDGTPVANHRVPVEIESEIEKLPGIVVLGNPRGDVTLVEFYDLNCPFCRKASGDIADILARDRELKLVLVPFPVLGIPSIAAARVEIAVVRLARDRFGEFHHKIFASRGTVDANKALAVTKEMGLATAAVISAANDDIVTDIMKAHVRLGDKMGLAATPSFVVKGLAMLGYPGRKTVEDIIAAVRKCNNIVCS